MNKASLLRYAELKKIVKDAEEELKVLNPLIVHEMAEAGKEEIEVAEVGSFSVYPKRTWTYPETIENALESIKVAKKTAEQTGDATYVEKPILTFNPVK